MSKDRNEMTNAVPETAGIDFDQLSCPAPLTDHEQVLLGHGSGGTLTADLIQRVFLQGYGRGLVPALEDQAVLALGGSAYNAKMPRIALTTDFFVVRPLVLPRRRHRPPGR